jgi:hypothetical protein
VLHPKASPQKRWNQWRHPEPSTKPGTITMISSNKRSGDKPFKKNSTI